jgi:serine protease Do
MATELERDLAALTARLRRSTLHVHDDRGRGSGSGVVWAPGVVVTNAHVVRGSRALLAAGEARVRAEIVARDEGRDLAILRFDPAGLDVSAADVRSSASLRGGELLVAVGNPLGLSGALSLGMLQRSNARWVVSDVRLAPGNSGGPLADVAGRVVGINSMVAGRMGLAVPSDVVDGYLLSRRGALGRAA